MGTKRKLPFGYKMESGRVVIDSVEKSWVLHLFSRYNMGVSIRELTEFMNNTAVSYDPGKPWNKNMVARILADTRYLGDSGFPVLIDAAVFLDAEEKRKKKAPSVQKNRCTDGAAEKMRVQDYTAYRTRGSVFTELSRQKSGADCYTADAERAFPAAGHAESGIG